MTKALSTDAPARTGGLATDRAHEWSPEQMQLLKDTVCKGATDDEFKLFAHVCQRTRLDPFAKQIHAVKRWNADLKREEMSFQTGIDGYRLIAQRTGEMDGQDGPYWCDESGKWSDVWLHDKPPAAAKVMVYRKGHGHPYTGVATFKAYVQRKRDGSPNRMWATMPDGQLAKCAEALALRKAFPMELSGVYTHDEMQQADNAPDMEPIPPTDRKPAPPPPKGKEKDTSVGEWTGRINAIEEVKNGVWKLSAEGGEMFGTSVPEHADVARTAVDNDVPVHIRFRPNSKGTKIATSLEPVMEESE